MMMMMMIVLGFLGLGETESTWYVVYQLTYYQPRMIDDDACGEVGRMRINRGNRSTVRQPALMPFNSPPGLDSGPPRWEVGD
jgi:hypothetical protein